ncbi:MAG: DUF2914 domain-containing protein [Ignavibacteriae bacterium]|nr:DUF2914 domain-containing protein [Ignavibacteriota bacterium]
MKTFSISILVMALCLPVSNIDLFAQEEAELSGLEIVDARLGNDVQDRMIVDEDSVFTKNSKVYLWMKVVGSAYDEITVTWTIEDHSYSTTLSIGGSPWRTWAYKTVWLAGDWTVTIEDAAGNVLKEMSFLVE